MRLQIRTGTEGSPVGSAEDRKRPSRSRVLIVLTAAIAIRILWVAYCCTNGAVFNDSHPFAAGEMGRIATNLAANRGFSSPFGMGSQPTAWESPLVPYFFSLVMKACGGASMRAAATVLYIQAVIGGFGAWLYWLVVRRLVHRNAGRIAVWVSPVVAVLVCIWPESVVETVDLWYYVWQEAFLALLLFALLLWREQSNHRRAAIAGICGGVLALISVTPVPAAVILMTMVGLSSPRRDYRPALTAGLCFAVVIAPWLVRNSMVFHAFVPLRSNAGYEIFQGNNAIECIREPVNAPHPATDANQYRLYQQMGEIRYSRYCLSLAASYVRAHPLQTAYRIGVRAYVVWLTDLTDHWAPSNATRWWQRSALHKSLVVVSSGLILLAALSFWWGVIRGRFARLPHAAGFGALLVLLPLPHYITLADPEYTTTFRMLVAITSVCMIGVLPAVRHKWMR
jgi:hypothetical protein